MDLSQAGIEIFIGCVLIAVATITLVFSKLTYRMIDATAGRTAEKWAKAELTLGSEWYPRRGRGSGGASH